MPLESLLVSQARDLASDAHADHVRKAGGIPYYVHLDAVAHLVAAHGYDDDATLAAAYLHDLLEDRPAFAPRLYAEMPRQVTETVEVLTEAKHDTDGRLQDKRARFQGYLSNLRSGTAAAARALAISCADKIDNARSIVDAERSGSGILIRLKTRPAEHAEQLAALREIFAPAVSPSLLATFDAAADELQKTIAAWVPGRAVMLAAEAHLGQFDKAGQPYIAHPLRLWMRAQTPEAKMAAVLHDVIEDSGWTLAAFAREGIPERVLRALDCLTKREGEAYDAFIERIAEDRLATEVKLLDLDDNSDLSRLSVIGDADLARVEKYRRATQRLEAELRKRSLFVVLDAASAEAVQRLAVHPEVRGDHITLAHRVDPDAFTPAWVPGGGAVGDVVRLRAVGSVQNERLQALVIEMGGDTKRPHDGGILHVTVSRAEGARSYESNDLVARGALTPMDLPLSGTLAWVD